LNLVVLTLCAAGWLIAQAPTPQPRADQEAITPTPLSPTQDPRQAALGERPFHGGRLALTFAGKKGRFLLANRAFRAENACQNRRKGGS
jgi:hypothetical protein